MSIFNSILEKLGLKKEEEAKPAVQAPKPTTEAPKPAAAGLGQVPSNVGAGDVHANVRPVLPTTPAAPVTPAKPAPMEMVDVMSKIDKMAKANPQKLEWKVSIVDLLKVLGIESSYDARKALAIELGCPPENLTDSARMNIWLHKTVLQKIAENGGNIPKELLD